MSCSAGLTPSSMPAPSSIVRFMSDHIICRLREVNILTFHLWYLPKYITADVTKHDAAGELKFWPEMLNFSMLKASFAARQVPRVE